MCLQLREPLTLLVLLGLYLDLLLLPIRRGERGRAVGAVVLPAADNRGVPQDNRPECIYNR